MLTRLKSVVRSPRRRPNGSHSLAVQIEQLESLQLLSIGPIPIRPIGPPFPTPIIYQPPPPPPLSPYPTADTPAQIADAYGFNKISLPDGSKAPLGTGQTIAIVEIGIDPTIQQDANVFNKQYSLPQLNSSNFLIYNAPGATNDPQSSNGDAFETSLDVEWAHAMAPGANILLVNEGSQADEANPQSTVDIDYGVNYAANWPGVSVVSISYGGNEYSGETQDDQFYTTPYFHNPVAFVASSGDSTLAEPGIIYPSASPEVLSVGGTTFTKALGNTGTHQYEDAWSQSGGGISADEPELVYNPQGQLVPAGYPRTTPDVAYNATNYSVYDTWDDDGWDIGHGTSFGAPQWSALVAIADQGRALQGLPTLDNLPSQINAIATTDPAAFHDITKGTNPLDGDSAGPGYDLMTGWGTPKAQDVVADLINSTYLPQEPYYATGNPLLYQGGPGPINPRPPVLNSGLGLLAMPPSTGGGTMAVAVEPPTSASAGSIALETAPTADSPSLSPFDQYSSTTASGVLVDSVSLRFVDQLGDSGLAGSAGRDAGTVAPSISSIQVDSNLRAVGLQDGAAAVGAALLTQTADDFFAKNAWTD
jgi:subtilase family serine protease